MMIFLHLFDENHIGLCINTFYIGNSPFALWLHKACNPVGFFLILSGYGMAYSLGDKRLTYITQIIRIFKLYVNYWVILFIFISLRVLMGGSYGTVPQLISNIIGWEYTYNAETWFLLPYCIISLLSLYIIRCISCLGAFRALLVSGAIYICICFVISRYGENLYDNMLLYRPLQVLLFLYSFTVGVVFYRLRKIGLSIPSWSALLGIVVLVSIVATFSNSVLYMIYEPLLTFLFCQLSIPKFLKIVLIEFGRKSMPMWLIHTWYCYYLFQSQIYSLHYPLLILIVVVSISYLTAIPTIWLSKCIINKVINQKQLNW